VAAAPRSTTVTRVRAWRRTRCMRKDGVMRRCRPAEIVARLGSELRSTLPRHGRGTCQRHAASRRGTGCSSGGPTIGGLAARAETSRATQQSALIGSNPDPPES
jgi:hypothetical protein